LPEVLTRDIISPVKRSVEGLSDLIKEYEKEQMAKEVYGLLPRGWHEEMRTYTESEFTTIAFKEGKMAAVSSDEVSRGYNRDECNARDGEIIEATDHLAAFIEAYMALKNGMTSKELEDAKKSLKRRYRQTVIAGIKFGEIYADFE
ncbi:MAG: HD domain-containing protein, partial [bacterium]